MIAAILFGRKGSVGFPGKNLYPVLNRPLCVYPLLAAVNSKKIDKIFVSTDDDEIMKIGEEYGAERIERPAYLANATVLVDEVFAHAHSEVKKRYDNVEMIVILVCNAPNILSSVIDQGIEKLYSNPSLDSAVGVSDYTTWTPMRARSEDSDGLLKPFIPFEAFGDPKNINCDVSKPETESAAVKELGPGIGIISISGFLFVIYWISFDPGSEIAGVPASVTSAISLFSWES